jgi:hypothetical protein
MRLKWCGSLHAACGADLEAKSVALVARAARNMSAPMICEMDLGKDGEDV